MGINQGVDLEAFHIHPPGGINPQSADLFLLMCSISRHVVDLSLLITGLLLLRLGHRLDGDHLILGVDQTHVHGVVLPLQSGGDLHIYAVDPHQLPIAGLHHYCCLFHQCLHSGHWFQV